MISGSQPVVLEFAQRFRFCRWATRKIPADERGFHCSHDACHLEESVVTEMAVDDKVIENLSTMASAANPPIDDLGATGFPSIAALTAEYDAKFFGGSLRDWCDVEWSAKMTMCAGICYYKKLPPMSLIQRATALSCVDGTVGGVSKSGRLSGQTAKRRRRQPAKGTLNDFWKTLEADPASLKVSSSTDSSPSTSPLLSDEERERVNGQRASTQPNNNISEHKDEEPIEETLKVPKNEPTKEPLKEPLEGAINDGMDVDERVAILMSRYPRCVIRLSEPLLKYRPLVDLKQTLIHEMIHAYVTHLLKTLKLFQIKSPPLQPLLC